MLSVASLCEENYGSVLRDCSEALKANTQCSKAYYRSAMALVALERYDEALDCCDRCLAYDHDNAGVGTLRSKATDLKEKKDRKEREQAEKLAGYVGLLRMFATLAVPLSVLTGFLAAPSLS